MRLLERIRALFNARNLDRDFDQELEMHLDLLAADFERRGMTPADARRAARVHFGGVAQLQEAHREVRGLPRLESVIQDVRYALRALRKNPGFTALAVLTLAIGIGVNTAVFTLWNAMSWRPIQAADPDRVVQLAHAGRAPSFSEAEYQYYRDHSRSFSALASLTQFRLSMSGVPSSERAGGGLVDASGFQFPRILGASEPITAAAVSANYFQLLGVPAAFGRVFLPRDGAPAAEPVAMLSENYWERRFSRDFSLLGRKLRLNGIDVTVVGITPRDFGGTLLVVPELWTPASLALSPARQSQVFGRLRPGVSPGQAREELNALQAALPPDGSRPAGQRMGMVVGSINRGGQPGEKETAGPVIMLGAFGLVLLIACANVASLLLARSAARQREISIRLAIGASRWRLVRQLLTENAVISLVAGAAAIAISWWVLRFVMVQVANSPFANQATLALDIAPDQRVLGYILFLAAVSTIGFGLAPALEASRPNLSPGLKDETARVRNPAAQIAPA